MLQLIPFLTKLISGGVGGLAKGAGAAAGGLGAMGEGLGNLVKGGVGELLMSGDPKAVGAMTKAGILPENLLGEKATGKEVPAGGLMPELQGLAPENPLTLTPQRPPMSLNQQPTLLGPLSPLDNPAAMEILPPAAQGNAEVDRSGGRKGLLGKYINTMEKVNDAMEATPILGHYLRSVPGELQERKLPVDLEQSRLLGDQRTYMEMLKQMEANKRAEERNRTTMQAGQERNRATLKAAGVRGSQVAEAARIGASQRDLASKRRAMVDIFKNWGNMDDVSRESARAWAADMGTPIPEEAEYEGFDLMKWVNKVKGKWKEWREEGKKVESDPLGLF